MKRIITATIVVGTVVGIALLITMIVERTSPDVATLARRVRHLEEVVARLERGEVSATKQHEITTGVFTPDGKTFLMPDGKSARIWHLPQSSPNAGPPVAQPVPNALNPGLPPGAQPREFNGMTYYLIPLAHASQKDAGPGLAK